MKLKLLLLLIILILSVNVAAAVYNSYNTATGAWNNTTYSNTLKYSTGEILLKNKLTDYVSFWGYDAASGTVEDYNSTTNLPLTISGGTRSTTSFYGRSLSLNGANGQYASPGYGYAWTSGAWTMSAWIKSVGHPVDQSAFAGRWSWDSDGYMVEFYTDGELKIWTDGNSCITAINVMPDDSAWHHLTVVKSGTGATVYVDGVSKACTGTLLNSWTNPGSTYRFEIGTFANDGGNNFNGLIDEFKIWNRALSSTEAGQLYSSTYATYGNVTTFYNASNAANITNKIDVNWTTPTGTNYTVWYKNSVGGTFTQLGGTLTGNNSVSATMFRNTTIEVRSKSNGAATTKGLQITYTDVTAGNVAPVLASIGAQNTNTRTWSNLTISATDANGDTITYGTNATKGTFNNATGEFSWHILAAENGTYVWNFTASDPYGGVDYEIVTFTIGTSLPFTLPQVFTNWWNTSWTYRVTSIVPDGQRPYQLSLNLSNSTGTNNATWIFCNGHCKPNFTDVRFTLDNGIALPFWIENVTSGKVWINLTANGNVNMYYGNTTGTSTSDGNTTFILFDDFPGTSLNSSKWTSDGAGSLTVSGGTIHLNEKKIRSIKTYGSGYFMRGRAKGGADTSNEWVIGFASYYYGSHSDTYISTPLEWDTTQTYFRCINGKDNQVYKRNNYATVKDNTNYHIGEYRRGGTTDTCILDDNQTINASYPSTNSRYLYADGHDTDVYVDWILMGHYSLTGSSWATWGAEETGSAGTEYIPPTPVMSIEINGTNYRYFAWSEGWGNFTDAYVVGLNDVWTVNTHIQELNETLSAHEWMNVSVYALNYSNSTVNMVPLDSNYQKPNEVPVLSTIGNKKKYSGNTLTIQMSVADNDSDTITYGTNASKGTLNTMTGVYTLAAVIGDVGVYSWYFNASDGYGGLASETITLTVLAPRIINVPLYNVGWQTVLVNETQTMDSLNTIFSPTYISIWNSTSQAWEKYKSGWSYHQTLSVSRDQAAIIKVTANVTKSINLTNTFNWTLKEGHNLIGIPQNMTLSEINSSVNHDVGCSNVDELTYVYPNNMSERTYTCENNATQANASVMVREGYGVWMYAVQAVDMKDVVG